MRPIPVTLCTVVTLLITSLQSVAAIDADLFVATSGNDRNSGSADAPFASIQQAQLAVRKLKQQDANRTRPIVVAIRGGTYQLAQPLTFTPDDSGTPQAPVIYCAASDQEVVLSSGVTLTDWQIMPDGKWQTSLPGAPTNHWVFSQLYLNNQRRFRPAWPASGYLFVADSQSNPPNIAPDGFTFHKGDLPTGWQSLNEKELCIIHNWNMSRFPIISLDHNSAEVKLSGRTWHPSLNDITTRNWYWVDNVAEAFNQPGQWYLQRNTGTISYIPLPGETPNNSEVVAPRHDSVISLQGDVAASTRVEHLIFRGLTLAFNNWNVPTNGYSYAQAEAPIIGALTARNASHIRVENCVVRHTGTYGIDFGAGCRDCSVSGCELFDLGAGGVKIGVAWAEEGDPRNYAYSCRVHDSEISYGGRVHPAGVGVWIGHAASNRVDRNTIHNLYYSGISAGWRWTFGPNPSHHNIIEGNHIHTIGQGVLSDMGGIYMLGEQPGSVERNNMMYNIKRARYGGWGIYFDSGSSHILVENNLVYDTEDGALIHGSASKSNVVRNNILAFGEKNQLTINSSPEGEPLRLERNIVLWERGDISLHLPGPRVELASNLYWRAEQSDTLMQEAGNAPSLIKRDKGALVADPKLPPSLPKLPFVLGKGAPASSIGFTPFDSTLAGCLTPKTKVASLPLPPEAYQPAPPEAELSLNDGFEGTDPGSGPSGWHLACSGRNELVQVTDQIAASGSRSLKVVDSIAGYEPHIYSYLVRYQGEVTFSFDLRLSPGAQPSVELRDVDPWYTPGPLLSVDKEGQLLATQGKILMQLPHDKWINLTISTAIGTESKGSYTVTVRLPEQEPSHFEDLPCSPRFKTLGWIGFCSNGSDGAIYWLDNLRLTP